MSGPIDGLVWLQWAGIVMPTLAVLGLFVRLGALLTTIKKLESDMARMANTLIALNTVAIELVAWREASKSSHDDVLERVRRLEDLELKR